MLIDTHCHLFDEQFKEDLDVCLKNAYNNGVEKILLVGFSAETNKKALELANKYDVFYPTCGIHPSEASKSNKEQIDQLESVITKNRVYAIGECGLDYYWVKDNKELQKELFIMQIELAIKYDLPIIIHMREATMDTFEILKKYKGKIRGVMHCYSGSYEMALRFIELGFYISLGGPVTFKNAVEPKRIAKGLSLDRLLIETDCPYLAPTPFRGKRNESAYVKNIALEIARLREITFEEVANITSRNAHNLFNLRKGETV